MRSLQPWLRESFWASELHSSCLRQHAELSETTSKKGSHFSNLDEYTISACIVQAHGSSIARHGVPLVRFSATVRRRLFAVTECLPNNACSYGCRDEEGTLLGMQCLRIQAACS